jgi:hypothetical protein
MAKQNNRTQEFFKTQLAARKRKTEEKNKINTQELSLILPNNDIEKVFQIPTNLYDDLTDDKELINFLNQKTLEITKINCAGNIIIGKELTEVYEKLAKKGSPEGMYLRFLTVLGYKKDSALRYRKRYELYRKACNSAAKQIISILPIRLLEKLYREQDLLKKIDIKEIDYKTASDIILRKPELILIEKGSKKEEFTFKMEELPFLQTQIKEKYDNLNQKEKEKLNKLLFEIKNILKINTFK